MKKRSIKFFTLLIAIAVALTVCVLFVDADSADAEGIDSFSAAASAFESSDSVEFNTGITVTSDSNFIVPNGKTLIIPATTTADCGSGLLITNNGTIINYGTLKIYMGTNSSNCLIKNYGRLELDGTGTFINTGKIFSGSDIVKTGSNDPDYSGLDSGSGGFIVVAPLTKVYDGSDIQPSLVRTGDYTYTTPDDYTSTCGVSGENVGDHILTIDFVDPFKTDIEVSYSITPAPLTLTLSGTATYGDGSVVYSIDDSPAILTDDQKTDFISDYATSEYTSSSVVGSDIDAVWTKAGTADTAKAAIEVALGGNYDVTLVAGKVVVSKADAAITTSPVGATSLTYTGEAQNLLSTLAVASGGTVYYKVDSGEYGTDAPTALAYGDHTVYYKVIGDANHNDVAEESLVVSIAKGTITITASSHNLTYGDDAPTYTVSANVISAEQKTYIAANYVSCGYSSTTAVSNSPVTVVLNTAANKTAIETYLTSSITNNYNIVLVDGAVTIARANDEWTTPGSASKTWGSDVVTAGQLASETVPVFAYYSNPERTSSIADLNAVNAGTTVYVKVTTEESTNYNAFTDISISFVVEKAASDIAIAAVPDLDYSAVDKKLVTKTGNNEQTVQYSIDGGSNWVTAIPVFTNAGEYTVLYKADASTNYSALAQGSVVVDVDKAASDIAIAAVPDLDYSAVDKELVTKTGNNEQTVQYSIDGGSNWVTAIPEFTNAGEYTVLYKADASTNYSALAQGSVVVDVDKAASSISVNASQTFPYDGSAPTIAVTKTGDGVVSFTYYSESSGGSALGSAPVNAGTWYVVATMAESTNYNGSNSGDRVAYTITAVDVSTGWVIAAIPNQAHTGSAITPALNVTFNTTPLAIDVDYTAAWLNNVDIGTATVTLTPVSPNFTGTISANFEIVPSVGEFYYVTIYMQDSGSGTIGPIDIEVSALPYTIPAKDAPEWDGFVLEHYHMAYLNAAADGSGTRFDFGQNITLADLQALDTDHDYNVDIYMIWEIDQFTVTITGEGVTVKNGDVTVASGSKVDYGTVLNATIADKVGYNKSVTPASITVTANVEFVGTYTPIAYVIAFDANGGTGSMANINATYDVEVTLTAVVFTKEGFAFGGWATAAEGAAVYSDGAKVMNLTSTVDATVTLYATWIKIEKTDNAAVVTVTIDEVSDQAADQLVNTAKEMKAGGTENVTVDVNATKTESVSIKSDSIKDAVDNGIGVNIATTNGAMEFSSGALAGLIENGKTLKSEIKQVEVPPAFASKIPQDAKVFSISLSSNDTAITSFGAAFTVKVAYQASGNTDSLYVGYLAADGTIQKMESHYEDGFMVFTTDHLSDYAVLEGSSSSGEQNQGLFLAIFLVAAVVLPIIAALVIFRKK